MESVCSTETADTRRRPQQRGGRRQGKPSDGASRQVSATAAAVVVPEEELVSASLAPAPEAAAAPAGGLEPVALAAETVAAETPSGTAEGTVAPGSDESSAGDRATGPSSDDLTFAPEPVSAGCGALPVEGGAGGVAEEVSAGRVPGVVGANRASAAHLSSDPRLMRNVGRRSVLPEWSVSEKLGQRQVEVELTQERVVYRPVRRQVERPLEVVKVVPRVVYHEVPEYHQVVTDEVVEVEKPYRVEQQKPVARYRDREVYMCVGRRCRPRVHAPETAPPRAAECVVYEPEVTVVDVYVPKVVGDNIVVTREHATSYRRLDSLPAAHWNSLCLKLNPELQQANQLECLPFVRADDGSIPSYAPDLTVGVPVGIVPSSSHVLTPTPPPPTPEGPAGPEDTGVHPPLAEYLKRRTTLQAPPRPRPARPSPSPRGRLISQFVVEPRFGLDHPADADPNGRADANQPMCTFPNYPSPDVCRDHCRHAQAAHAQPAHAQPAHAQAGHAEAGHAEAGHAEAGGARTPAQWSEAQEINWHFLHPNQACPFVRRRGPSHSTAPAAAEAEAEAGGSSDEDAEATDRDDEVDTLGTETLSLTVTATSTARKTTARSVDSAAANKNRTRKLCCI